MPQHSLETLLASRVNKPVRDPVKWGGGTQGDPEEALNLDDRILSLLMAARNGDDVSLEDMPPTPENEDIAFHMPSPEQGITQEMFDKMRGSRWAHDQMGGPSLEGYERKYFDQNSEKK